MSEEEQEVEFKERSISMALKQDGTMNIDFNGEFKLYEVVGMISVTLMDLFNNNFIAGNFKELTDTIEKLAANQGTITPDVKNSLSKLAEIGKALESFSQ